jgi:2-aminoadipate transaminase
MLQALEEHFPKSASWTHPDGGLFLWGTLPEGLYSEEVLKVAVEEKVAFVPGSPFYALGGGENTMRLNFSFASPEDTRLGVARLGKVLKSMLLERESEAMPGG